MPSEDDQKQLDKAIQYVLRLFKYRPRSEQEIINRLKDRQYSETTITNAIHRLKKYQLIDDHQFAKSWIRSRLSKPFGINRIKYELKQKGIAPRVLNEELSHCTQDYDEVETAVQLARRKLQYMRPDEPLKIKRKLYDFLKRRGFRSSAIYAALKEIEADQS